MKRTVPKDARPEGVELCGFLIDARQLAETVKDGTGWLQAFPMGEWYHPVHGEIVMDEETATQMKDNFDRGVRGQDIPLDYEHGQDVAKGGKAAGWVHDMQVRTSEADATHNGLWWNVSLTPTALREVRDGEWRYFSPEYARYWEDPRTQDVHNNVVFAGALTNKPFLKGIVPLNLNEVIAVSEISDKEHAEPGTHGGEGGEPTPLSQDKKGNQDPEAPFAAAPWYPPLSSENVQPYNEGDMMDKKKLCEQLGLPEDATDEQIVGKLSESRTALRGTLGLSEDASEQDVTAAVTKLQDDAKLVEEIDNDNDEDRKFREQFPKRYEAMKEQEAALRKSAAREFSERYQNVGGKALPPVVIEKLSEVHVKLAEGSFTHADLKEIMDGVMESGLVKLGETGGTGAGSEPESGATPEDFRKAIKQFQEQDGVDYRTAFKLAAESHPDGFKAYRDSVRSRQPIESS